MDCGPPGSSVQGNFPTQGLKPHLLHCRRVLYRLSHCGNPWGTGSREPVLEPRSGMGVTDPNTALRAATYSLGAQGSPYLTLQPRGPGKPPTSWSTSARRGVSRNLSLGS